METSNFSNNCEVSSENMGGKILFATDDFFAVAENLLKNDEPKWEEGYTEFGKWMDGWETRRKRIPGHDWTIIVLEEPCQIHGIQIDTAFFTGNYAPRFSLQAAYLREDPGYLQNRDEKLGSAATKDELRKASLLKSDKWEILIPMTKLRAGYTETRKQYFTINTQSDARYTHLRLNIFPDGGIARLRIYGKFESTLLAEGLVPHYQQVKGKCVQCSNAHYGHPDNLFKLTPPVNMADGWETARRMDRPPMIAVDDAGFLQVPGKEWAIFTLEGEVFISRIEIDTTHFKGNCPDNVKLEGALIKNGESIEEANWKPILHLTKLMPNQSNGLKHPYGEVMKNPVNYVKVTIAPDGGIARLRLFVITSQERY